MPKFIVPPEMYPGVMRYGYPRKKVGSVLTWPDRNRELAMQKLGITEKPPKLLIPIDDEGYQLLCECYPEEAKKGLIAKPAGAPESKKPEDALQPMTVAEAVEEAGMGEVKASKKSRRAADSE